jgi:hypothetical protein
MEMSKEEERREEWRSEFRWKGGRDENTTNVLYGRGPVVGLF